MKRAIIFDLDGTLIDTPRGIVETFAATLQSMGFKFVDTPMIRAMIGLPLDQTFSSLMGLTKEDEKVVHAVKQYQILFKEIVLPKAQELIFPGVSKSLEILKVREFSLAVATSKFYKNAEALLKAACLWDFFDLVVGADQVTYPKPHPEMGLLVIKKLGISAEKAIMVGDTTHDLFMARDAGMRSIAVSYGVHDLAQLQAAQPTWVAHTFADVMTHVLNLN